jgi:hypothetical protein
MTLFIVGAAGFGMMIMLREQTGATLASDTQANLNRAADFIKEEIQTADLVETGIALPSGCGTGSTATLRLRVPFTATSGTANGTSAPYFVYYSLRTPSSPWLGNRAIFRCGPSFNANGIIVVNATTGLPDLQSDVLVDLIALTRDPKDPGNCSNSGTAYPNNNVGFFVCVVNGKQVEIHLAASALDNTSGQIQWISSDANSRFNDKARYGVVTQVYARSKTPIPLTSSTSSGGTFSASASVNATFVTSGCPTTFFPTGSGIDIDGTATNITANGTISVIISGTSLNLTPPTVSPALTDFTFTASTNGNGGTFTSGTCTVAASLST